ncbi:MAG: fatty acyl-AMP ligase, partial [Scytonema sp. PMC 1069.18]|nr:fatty acyl-AMP ligase [Scytonema sp. PMC 1069.18]
MYNNSITKHISQCITIIDILKTRALYQSQQVAYTFLVDGETQEVTLTYQQLDQKAKAIAYELQSLKATGERALLLYPSGLEFIAAFFGCLYAGVVAVPANPPRRNQLLTRLQAIAKDSQATIVLTTTSILNEIKQRFQQETELATLPCIATENLDTSFTQDEQLPQLSSDTLAFLQYTSGSTSTPKGVAIAHANLMHNEEMIKRAFQHTEKSLVVGWLPLFHDMGLIGNVLQPLYMGIPTILMSPVAFLHKPSRWLKAISHYKATTSGGPNFAYDLCVSQMTLTEQESLDLSSWNLAFNGAEPVRSQTLEQFAEKFASCGFRKEALYPCYGMAETTLFVSGRLKTSQLVIQTVDAAALEQNQVVVETQNQKSHVLVSCGKAWHNQQVIIVNPETLVECPPGRIGEIWVWGPSVARGYWRRPEETEQTFRAYLADTGAGPFLRTGDLGFFHDDELFVTGRLKDVIIIRGQNHYPQDIELTVEKSHPALRPGCGAAFCVNIDNAERLVIVQEVERSYLRKLDGNEVVGNIREAVTAQHSLQVYAVVLLKTGSIPKTSSGKIQRYACRSGFLSGSLNVVYDWSQNIPSKHQFLDVRGCLKSPFISNKTFNIPL